MQTRRQAIIWANDGMVYWRIYASLGLSDLRFDLFNLVIVVLHATSIHRAILNDDIIPTLVTLNHWNSPINCMLMPLLGHLGPLLLTWINFIPAWISYHLPSKVWDEITYAYSNFNGCTIEVWEWISNFFPHLKIRAITFPCRDES